MKAKKDRDRDRDRDRERESKRRRADRLMNAGDDSSEEEDESVNDLLDSLVLKMKAKIVKLKSAKKDIISSLSDDLIHHILSFSDVQSAVQTSVLSKRWKFIWTTLPFLNFFRYGDNEYRPHFYFSRSTEIEFFENFFSGRNNESQIVKLNLAFQLHPSPYLIEDCVKYAVLHNVKDLDVSDNGYNETSSPVQFCFDNVSLCTFSSNTVTKLSLRLNLGEFYRSKCWDLPVLTTLYLRHNDSLHYNLCESYLTCLSSLRTLSLDHIKLPESICLPNLRTLCLRDCTLPEGVWDLPALLTLELDGAEFPENRSEFFSALVGLQNLTLSRWGSLMTDCVINCPQLVNLEINADMYTSAMSTKVTSKIIVSSPNICNFSYSGFFRITFGAAELENVNINMRDDGTILPWKNLGKYKEKDCCRVTDMFCVLGRAKILTLDLETIEALSAISDFLVNSPSPFSCLMYVKVPQGYKRSSMSSDLKSYLLDHSPNATIVTTLPQNMSTHTEAATMKAQNVVLQEALGAPTKVLVNSESIHKTACIDTADTGVQEELVGQNSLLDVDRVRQIGLPVERTGNDLGSSSGGDSDFGLWQGYEVNSEFVCLLDLIMDKYPETLELFNTKNKKFCTMKLNMLCTSVNDFTRISMSDVNTELIAEYRDICAELQKCGFNVSWLVSRLDYIEQVCFSQPLISEFYAIDRHIGDAKSKLEEFQIRVDDIKSKLKGLQSLRAEKMQRIQKDFGTLGTNLLSGYIGDGLLSSP